jgi:hypothetical protein
MGQMCCTKYGEDGQSALILDKGKNKPENKHRSRKNKDISNQTYSNGDINNDEFTFPTDKMRMADGSSRNHKSDLSGDNSNNSLVGFPQNPMNTQMGDEESAVGRS